MVFVEKDPSLNEEQKYKLKERVNERKKIIEKELTTNIEEEQQKEQIQEKKDDPKKDPTKTSTHPSSITTSIKDNKSIDYYSDKLKNKYHVVAKMDSLGVLDNELKVCDNIIAYKKKKNEDFETWELKKESIETKNQFITSNIESGRMDFEGYKKKIKVEYQRESKLLAFVEKDPSLNETQKKILTERVNNRKKIIEEELTKNLDVESKEEEEPKSKEEKQKKKKEELLVKKV